MTQNAPILQNALPCLPWSDPRMRRLPGILPLTDDSWIDRDEAFAAQMARRDQLISGQSARVHALLPEAIPAAEELYTLILKRLSRDPGYRIGATEALRPDGVSVPLDPSAPLLTLGRLVQEDLCLMETSPEGHRLTGAILCFPASWTLAQKIGGSLLRIHIPVAPYDERLAKGVQRLFDAIRPEQPLWRMNFLTYDDPELHQPRAEGEARPRPERHEFIRCEKQCLLRLPQSQAALFSIHTWQIRAASLSEAERAVLLAAQHS